MNEQISSTEEHTSRKENLKDIITGVGVCLVVGGDFLQTETSLDPTRQEQLQQKVRQLVDRKKPIDPQLIKAVSRYSTTNRQEFWEGVPDAFERWKTSFTGWLLAVAKEENGGRANIAENKSSSLSEVLPLPIGEMRPPNVQSANMRTKLGEQIRGTSASLRRQILSDFGIDLTIFGQSATGEQDQQIKRFYETYGGETDVERITQIFLHAAQDELNNVVNINILQKALSEMDMFLNLFGLEAKEAIREQILARGFIQADEQTQTIFIEAAPAAILTDKQKNILVGVQKAYQALQESSINNKLQTDNEQQLQGEATTPLSKPTIQPTEKTDIQVNQANLEPISSHDGETQTQEQSKVSVNKGNRKLEQQISLEGSTSVGQQDREIVSWTADITKHVTKSQFKKPGAIDTRNNISENLHVTDLDKENWHPLVADAGGKTEKDRWHRENQDAFFVDKKHGAFGVFDGLGEAAYPAEASTRASGYLKKAFERMPEGLSLEETQKYVRDVIVHTSIKLFSITYDRVMKQKQEKEAEIGRELSKEEVNAIYQKHKNVDMDTTASIVKLWEGEIKGKRQKKAIIANVGDSRVYYLHQGRITCLTLDDTEVRTIVGDTEAKRIQDIKDEANDKLGYKYKTTVITVSTPEQLKILNQVGEWHGLDGKKQPLFTLEEEREVSLDQIDYDAMTQTLGSPTPPKPNMQVIDLEPEDRIILVSDGIYDTLRPNNTESIVNEYLESAQAAADELLAEVERRKKGHDDMTAIVVTIK